MKNIHFTFEKRSAIFLTIALVWLVIVKEHSVIIFKCLPDCSYKMRSIFNVHLILQESRDTCSVT